MKLKSLRLKKSEEKSDEISVGYRPKPTFNKATFLLVFGVLLASASFYEGTAYQRNIDTTDSSSTAATTNIPTTDSSGGNGTKMDSYVRDHVLGQVTAISSTSITVQDENTTQSVTLSIAKSTQIVANGQAITATEIQEGDLVIITKTSASSTTASRIIVTQGILGGSGTDGSSTNQSNTSQSSTGAPYQPLESN